MKPVHVVHIIPTLTIGGAERFVVSLCAHTNSDRVVQTVITLWGDAPLASALPRETGYRCIRIDTISKRHRVRALATLLTELRADVVHTHLFSADLWGRLAAKRLGIPVVTTEHNINMAEPWHWRLIKRSMRGMSRMYTAPSQAVGAYLTRAYGVPPDAITIIPHGIPTAQFAPIAPAAFVPPVQLLIVARLVEQKGHRILFDALAQLTDVSYQLHIVGDGPLRSALKSAATTSGIAEQIVWHGAVPDPTAYYAAADVVVMPSLWEGFGLVALEALASGRPLIVSAVDGLGELVEHGHTGYTVPPGESTALAHMIRTVLADPSAARTVAARGRAWVRAHGDIRHMGERYERVYEEIGK